jgi:hypothetical protein
MEPFPSLKKALHEVTQWLNSLEIPFMLIGGVAASFHGMPRQTFDIDIKFQLKGKMNSESFIGELEQFCTIIPSDPAAFLREMNVLPAEVEGVRIDFILANLPFEITAIKQSVIQNVYGVMVPVCTPEDLIIQKAISTRSKDWMDIETVANAKAENLDWNYIIKHCQEMSRFLHDSTIMDKIERIKNES